MTEALSPTVNITQQSNPKKTMNEKKPSTKKITRIINLIAIIWAVVLFAIVICLRIKTDLPAVLLYLCLGFVYTGGLTLFQKIIERSRYSKDFEEANREVEKEEEMKSAKDESPGFYSLAIVAVVAMICAVSRTVETVKLMISDYSNELPINAHLPQCINILTLLACGVFIAVILYNVSKRRVFDSRNSFCIYGVGATIIISTLLQSEIWETTPMIPNDTVQMYYMIFGIFIVFFGNLFDIAVKLKKEQDLTI
ncbi:MAG: DUF2975 domain-containing protein [Bacteroidaceae bacterium]|nr:DUF2975 domain-containing protein [Bacteroidaceae bacterium]